MCICVPLHVQSVLLPFVGIMCCRFTLQVKVYVVRLQVYCVHILFADARCKSSVSIYNMYLFLLGMQGVCLLLAATISIYSVQRFTTVPFTDAIYTCSLCKCKVYDLPVGRMCTCSFCRYDVHVFPLQVQRAYLPFDRCNVHVFLLQVQHAHLPLDMCKVHVFPLQVC